MNKKLKQLKFRSWHRGMIEMDILMGGFFDMFQNEFSEKEINEIDKFIGKYLVLNILRNPPIELPKEMFISDKKGFIAFSICSKLRLFPQEYRTSCTQILFPIVGPKLFHSNLGCTPLKQIIVGLELSPS